MDKIHTHDELVAIKDLVDTAKLCRGIVAQAAGV
jgi:hypothetical protein